LNEFFDRNEKQTPSISANYSKRSLELDDKSLGDLKIIYLTLTPKEISSMQFRISFLVNQKKTNKERLFFLHYCTSPLLSLIPEFVELTN